MSRTKRKIPTVFKYYEDKLWQIQYYGKLSIYGDSVSAKRYARKEERRQKKAEKRDALKESLSIIPEL